MNDREFALAITICVFVVIIIAMILNYKGK